MHNSQRQDWFVEWFASPYYRLLYSNRDQNEAALLIENLIKKFNPNHGVKILDLPCGEGRHALQLNQLGFDVTGADLSERSIQFAKQFENETLKFFVHDIRKPFAENQFDWVLNLFTSFGYFNSEKENQNAMQTLSNALKPGGLLIIDFLNKATVLHCLPAQQEIEMGGVKFQITKSVKEKFVVKEIEVNSNGKIEHFVEQVQLLSLSDFEKLFSDFGLKLIHTFGDYQLNPFSDKSERLILVARK